MKVSNLFHTLSLCLSRLLRPLSFTKTVSLSPELVHVCWGWGGGHNFYFNLCKDCPIFISSAYLAARLPVHVNVFLFLYGYLILVYIFKIVLFHTLHLRI